MRALTCLGLLLSAFCVHGGSSFADDPGLKQALKEQPLAAQRYTMSSYGETLVLLDAVTGDTWILRESESQALNWVPIRRETKTSSIVDQAISAAKSDLAIQYVPELGTIILRGTKEDVDAVRKAMRQSIAQEPKPDSKPTEP